MIKRTNLQFFFVEVDEDYQGTIEINLITTCLEHLMTHIKLLPFKSLKNLHQLVVRMWLYIFLSTRKPTFKKSYKNL